MMAYMPILKVRNPNHALDVRIHDRKKSGSGVQPQLLPQAILTRSNVWNWSLLMKGMVGWGCISTSASTAIATVPWTLHPKLLQKPNDVEDVTSNR